MLLLDASRHHKVPNYVGKIFRRTYKQVKQEGGIWPKSYQIFPYLRGKPNKSELFWEFPWGSVIGFGNLETEEDIYNYDGAELAYIGLDELTAFSAEMFWHMHSIGRTTCGVHPVLRGTCNPDPDSFVKELILWWLDENGQFPCPEKTANPTPRWFVRDEKGNLWWHDQPDTMYWEICDKAAKEDPFFRPTSLVFIPASVDDNPTLRDMGYKSKLLALPYIKRQRMLYGDWKIKPSAGMIFKRKYFRIIDEEIKCQFYVRYWDRAATEEPKKSEKGKGRKPKDPDYTAGVLMGITEDNDYVILDVKHFRGSPLTVQETILKTSAEDVEKYGWNYLVGLEQEPGASGKMEIEYYERLLEDFDTQAFPARQKKVLRAEPLSAKAEHGSIYLVRAPWNEELIQEAEAFPDGPYDDMVDAMSGAFSALQDYDSSDHWEIWDELEKIV